MKKSECSATLALLSKTLNNFGCNLNAFDSSQRTAILQEIEEIQNLIQQLNGLNLLILAEQDYANFCMLILYGSLMATQLAKSKRISRKTLKLVQDWYQLEMAFKPLLQENAIYFS